MTRKIAIIGVYFGKFPEYIEMWKKSCFYNQDIDFLVFTDQKENSKEKNIKYIKMTLNEFNNIAKNKLNLDINIERPYKCCDFRPAYGKIFEDYLKGYDFWGHCDFDMIFGNIKGFITDDIMEKYDKILSWGHLSLYRNTKENNDRYKCPGSEVGAYKEVFTGKKSYVFDETNGIVAIYKKNNFPIYDKRVFADISKIYNRFKLAVEYKKNFNNQVFYWEKGKVYRAYKDKLGDIKTEEYIYIHYKERKNMCVNIKNINDIQSFFITNNGFFSKEIGLPSIEEINTYNKYKGRLYEKIEELKFHTKSIIKKIKEGLL